MKDQFSNNVYISFLKNQGNGDRAYMIETAHGSSEVQLASRVVNGLKELNSGEKRKNQQFDKAFVKALMVSLIGIKKIKDGEVDKDVLNLIKSKN